MECMRDFAVDDNFSYSFDHLISFNYFEMMETNSEVKVYFAAKEVLTFIKNEMLNSSRHTKLLVVLKGSKYVNFQHAICFIRKDFNKLKQLLMMDCKNSGPCVFPTIHQEQLWYTDDDKVDAKKDL